MALETRLIRKLKPFLESQNLGFIDFCSIEYTVLTVEKGLLMTAIDIKTLKT